MNIFLPYADDIEKSVQSLDDRRLNKQILECKQLLDVARGKSEGYSHHPVAVHYKNCPYFINLYGCYAVFEYKYRFNKIHKFFFDLAFAQGNYDNYLYKPFYAEYPKIDKRCIRTTENVSELFQQKLIRKWNSDKIPPKWTNRQMPEFYRRKKNEQADVNYC